MHIPPNHICKTCEKPFYSRYKPTRYCSGRCSQRAKDRREKGRPVADSAHAATIATYKLECRACGCEFTCSARHARYCSEGCRRHCLHLSREWGLSYEQYRAMLAAQGSRCAICEQPSTGKRLAIDHDHSTGEIRGLLCHSCNTALGSFRRRPAAST